MRVLLPAPFSPTTAWNSPVRMSRETLLRASTPGKDFESSVTDRMTCWSATLGYPQS